MDETAASSAADADDAPLRALDFVPTDAPLREDVRRLGALVGAVIAEQQGSAFFERVERIRRAAIASRESGTGIDALDSLLEQATLPEAEALVRAFATWFGAINLAERVHRIRRRRDYERDAQSAPQPGGVLAVLQQLRDEGVGRDEVLALLGRMQLQPVFTAHPTEAVRRALLEKEREIVGRLVADLDRTRTPPERRIDLERMRMALTAGWQTAETASERPTVADELEHVGFYLSDVLYRVLPVFHEVLDDALERVYGADPVAVAVTPGTPFGEVTREAAADTLPLLRFGSWVGGDMDGNPNVGAATIAATLASHRALAIAAYRSDLAHLASMLSQTASRVQVSAAVKERTVHALQLLPQTARRIKARQLDMPYRTLLRLMSARLAATAAERAGGYPDAGEFVADLEAIGASLRQHHGEHAGWFGLRRVLRRARAFGFHLATLDLRQDARVHEQALAVLLGDPQWAARSAEQRTARLQQALQAPPHVPEALSDEASSVLEVFATVAAARPRYGCAAIGPYIVSMSRSAADALAVLQLARCGGCVDAGGGVPLDVAPLFETVDDLDAAPEVVAQLFADPLYRAHLAARGGMQMVMLGYSDSAKDGGLVASRWALQQTQLRLTALARESGIRIVYFHGRGGSISRGGGKTERAVIAAPRGSVDGFLRITEQGEVIHRKYGIRAIALRNLEQTAGAVLRATLRPRPAEPREAAWRSIATSLASVSRAHYRTLVYDTPGFVDYFRLATPIDVIERLKISSRPAKRAAGGQAGIDSLRAIPWVFAWSQNRCGLTAWYGAGSALEAALATHGRERIAEMARDWPFFATLLDDLEMVLAKSDLRVFARYSQLAGALHAQFHPLVVAEFERVRAAVLAIKGSTELLEGDRRLALSIRLRNPYVDPISLLQVRLLQRWRAGERRDEALFHALATTVNGIAAGVQNTG